MRFGVHLPRVYFDGGETGGGSGSEPPKRENPADIVKRYGDDVIRLASDLSQSNHENFKLRDKNRDLVRENGELKGKVPAEGTVVLTKEQAEVWQSLQKLELKPDAIAVQLKAGQDAIERATRYEREGVKGVLDLAAEGEKLKPGMLKILAKNLNIQSREVDVTDAEGRAAKQTRYFIVDENGGKEKLTGLRDYFKSQGDDVLESLDAGDGTGSGGNSTGGNSGGQAAQGGRQYPAQGAGGGRAKVGAADNWIAKKEEGKKEKKNPLMA